MKTAEAKKLAHAAGFAFYFDRSLRLWSLYPEPEKFPHADQEAEYYAPRVLAAISVERFKQDLIVKEP